jgi:hypothetical protein
MNRESPKAEFRREDCGKEFKTEKELKEHERKRDCSQEGSQSRWKSDDVNKGSQE